MLSVTVDLEWGGFGKPRPIERLYIANRGSAGEGAANYAVWTSDPREARRQRPAGPLPEPDAWVFGHVRDDGALVLVARAIDALTAAGCVGDCRVDS